MGERTERNQGRIKQKHGFSLYADDSVLFFNTSDDLTNDAHWHWGDAIKD
jgi:hypothetical protein